jgi:hypothetical protein
MTLQCSIKDCNSTALNRLVKGYCMMHYTRLRNTGELGPSVKFSDSWGKCFRSDCSKKAGPTGACRQHWHQKNSPLKSRSRALKSKGLTLDSYEATLKSQNNGCKICGATKPGHQRKNFSIDHDHSCCSGQVTCGKCFRGILCVRCNLVLGELQDSVELLEKMISYLTAPIPLDV